MTVSLTRSRLHYILGDALTREGSRLLKLLGIMNCRHYITKYSIIATIISITKLFVVSLQLSLCTVIMTCDNDYFTHIDRLQCQQPRNQYWFRAGPSSLLLSSLLSSLSSSIIIITMIITILINIIMIIIIMIIFIINIPIIIITIIIITPTLSSSSSYLHYHHHYYRNCFSFLVINICVVLISNSLDVLSSVSVMTSNMI